MGFDLTTLLIWTLRIVLPILFFAIYFRLQAPAKNQEKSYAGPNTTVHSRDKLLLLKKAVDGAEAHESMKNMVMKGEKEAPHLFAGKRSTRVDRPKREVGENGRVPKEGREKREKKPKEEPTTEVTTVAEEKMSLDEVLMYVAVFSSKITGATEEKANDEAQLVLRGALGLSRPDVAQDLYDRLMDAGVAISETTFELMIDVCLSSKDLKGASDLLVKMEGAGYTPNSQMLDKVLELYSEKEKDKVEKGEEDAPALDMVNAVTPTAVETTTSDVTAEYPMPATVMVPTFNWDAIESDSGDDSDGPAGDSVQLRTNAPVFVPSVAMLNPTAEPFNPQYNMTFDPVNYTWTSMDQPAAESWYSNKGAGKGKETWTSKDNGWHAKGGKDSWNRDKASKEEKEKSWEGKDWKPKAGNSWEAKPEMRWRAKPSESKES